MSRIGSALRAALGGLMVVATASPAGAASPTAAVSLGFGGAELGMSLDQWRALAPPGSARDHVQALCAATPAPAPARADERVCTYRAVYGRYRLPAPARPLAGRYLASDVSYRFAGARLASIALYSSVDAFNVLDAQLRAKYGAPSKVVRDRLNHGIRSGWPRVTETWILPAGAVQLVDPSDRSRQLLVRFAARGGAPAA